MSDDRSVHAFVPGIPVPQGSKRIGRNRRTGKAVLIEQSDARLKQWREDIGLAMKAQMAGRVPSERPCVVLLEFVFPAVKGHVGSHDRRPDVDKLQRAVFDAMSGIVFDDDRRVSDVTALKRYAVDEETPGVRIIVIAKEH